MVNSCFSEVKEALPLLPYYKVAVRVESGTCVEIGAFNQSRHGHILSINDNQISQDPGGMGVRMVLNSANDELRVLWVDSKVCEAHHWIDCWALSRCHR